jgi:hypothetical protein
VSRAIANLLLQASSRYRIQEDAVFKMRQPPARASRDPLADPYDKAAAMPPPAYADKISDFQNFTC